MDWGCPWRIVMGTGIVGFCEDEWELRYQSVALIAAKINIKSNDFFI